MKNHFGAAIGCEDFKASYVKPLIDMNHNQLIQLFVGRFKEKLTYYMSTIPCTKDYLMPLEKVIRFKFIPSNWGKHLGVRVLLSLPTGFVGFGITLFHENTDIELKTGESLRHH